jgi:23S rRNA A1618 N6-methylase RlmF
MGTRPHPFHGPVVPGEADFVAHIADQLRENLPQQNLSTC